MFTNEQKELLVHHGIKGQQWGVRNGPPYPLTESIKRSVKKMRDRRSEILKKGKRIIAESVVGGIAWGAIPIIAAGSLTVSAIGAAAISGMLSGGSSAILSISLEDLRRKIGG